MKNNQRNNTVFTITFSIVFYCILCPIFAFVGGYCFGWIVELFLSKPIIHAFLIFGVTILPEYIPYICASLSLFFQMIKVTLGDLMATFMRD